MIDENMIRFIVGTYDLPTELEEKLVRIAARRLKELEFGGVDESYRYIDGLVGKFTLSKQERREKYALSLDSKISSGGKKEREYHELLGQEDKMFETVERFDQQAILDNFLNLVDGMGEDATSLIRQLIAEANRHTTLNVGLDKFLFKLNAESMDQEIISQRLSQLKDIFEYNGRILIPRRPIKQINLEPALSVSFGKRNYHGDALAFFLSHQETYSGLGVSELRKVDYGLEAALRRCGKLRIAIPFDKRTISHKGEMIAGDAKAKIILAYNEYGGNASEAARHLPHDRRTISKYWKSEGLEVTETKLSQEEVKKITEAYRVYDGNASKAAKDLRYSFRTILKYWKLGELKPKKGVKLSQEDIHEIVESHSTYGGHLLKAAKELKHDASTVRKYWKMAGLRT